MKSLVNTILIIALFFLVRCAPDAEARPWRQIRVCPDCMTGIGAARQKDEIVLMGFCGFAAATVATTVHLADKAAKSHLVFKALQVDPLTAHHAHSGPPPAPTGGWGYQVYRHYGETVDYTAPEVLDAILRKGINIFSDHSHMGHSH